MAVSFRKQYGVELETEKICIGLKWETEPKIDPRDLDDRPLSLTLDLDLIILLLNSKDKVRGDSDCVFYGNKESKCGSVCCVGDNISGSDRGSEKDADDEVASIDFKKLPKGIKKIKAIVSINDGERLHQTFKNVEGYLRVYDCVKDFEIARVALSHLFWRTELCDRTYSYAIECGEFIYVDGKWNFKPAEVPKADRLADLARSYGVDVAED